MKTGWMLALVIVSSLLASFATVVIVRWTEPPPPEPKTIVVEKPPEAPAKIDAAQISTGQLPMERMPQQVTKTLEVAAEEIVKNAEALDQKQARITGTCPPGAAIRVIGEDGEVKCQRFPRGVVSVTSLAGLPRLDTTVTAPASVKGGVGRYQSAGPDDYVIVPVALPDGATITHFNYVYYDNAEELDGKAFLFRSDDQELASASTSGASSDVRAAATDEIRHAHVDAQRFAYFVYFQMSSRAGNRLVPISASISYRLP